MVFFRKQRGFISLFITLGMLLIALAIPVTVKLVEQNQETRSKARVIEDDGGWVPPAAQEPRPQSGSDLPSGYHPESQPAQEAPQQGGLNPDSPSGYTPPAPQPVQEARQPRDEAPAPPAPPAPVSDNYAAQNAQRQAADNAAQEVANAAAQAELNRQAAMEASRQQQEEYAQEQQKQAVDAAAKAAQDEVNRIAAQNAARQAADNVAQQAADQAAVQARVDEAVAKVAREEEQARQQVAAQQAQQPTPIATLNLSPTPTPAIQATIPLGGNTVGSGSVTEVYGSYPSKADIALDKELEPLSNAALFVTGTSLAGVGIAAAAPEVAAGVGLASVYATNVLASLPAWTQTGLAIGGMVGIVAACQDPTSNDCAAAITGLQVAQLAQQAASSVYQQSQQANLLPKTFQIEQKYEIIGGHPSPAQPIQYTTDLNGRVLTINSRDQLISADLGDPLLQNKIKEAADFTSGGGDLYQYTQDLFTVQNQGQRNAYWQMMKTAIAEDKPVSLSRMIIDSTGGVCFERSCFRALVNEAMGVPSQIDIYMGSEQAGGHATVSPLGATAQDLLKRFSMEENFQGAVQTIDLFGRGIVK